jgi:hypothetical protein
MTQVLSSQETCGLTKHKPDGGVPFDALNPQTSAAQAMLPVPIAPSGTVGMTVDGQWQTSTR